MTPNHLASDPGSKRMHAGKPATTLNRSPSRQPTTPHAGNSDLVQAWVRRSGAAGAETPSIGLRWAGKLVPRQGLRR